MNSGARSVQAFGLVGLPNWNPTNPAGPTTIFSNHLLSGIGINILQQGAGVNVVIYYSAVILKEGGFTDQGLG